MRWRSRTYAVAGRGRCPASKASGLAAAVFGAFFFHPAFSAAAVSSSDFLSAASTLEWVELAPLVVVLFPVLSLTTWVTYVITDAGSFRSTVILSTVFPPPTRFVLKRRRSFLGVFAAAASFLGVFATAASFLAIFSFPSFLSFKG